MTPPPNELDALVRAARGFAGPPPDVAARLVERLDVLAAGAPAAAAATAGWAGVTKSVLVLGGSALFIAGALAGGGLVWAIRGAQTAATMIAVVQPAPVPEAPAVVLAVPQPRVEEPVAAKEPEQLRPAGRKPPVPPPPTRSTLEAERQLLDVARSEVMRGAWPEALSAIDAHRTQFPAGALAEEREVLAIQSLAATDPQAAAARAAAFRAKWPSSILEPVVELVVPRDGKPASPQ